MVLDLRFLDDLQKVSESFRSSEYSGHTNNFSTWVACQSSPLGIIIIACFNDLIKDFTSDIELNFAAHWGIPPCV